MRIESRCFDKRKSQRVLSFKIMETIKTRSNESRSF
uniref:Uncharacterized protein n=1 Tax=Siphoviridae sp. ct7dP4 TaxID=2827787 RepID=A0A8S5TNR1_9CAUD|nr:MAG TPA: hypothetical protein [Caudoviricetes sp.]DAF64767.1 MAG TPA: hypothetical protein [Siphoviridae sp. ct7dP4]DAI31393.1 MAG TPA: hypothetical protein [Caudoviricetes sp.]DAK11531.1 MAG TPA: hypothetical protein [Caudoviricetes sp.]DAK48996.1 MAG TPA: hypothetical protein [Caudoviricetes sp.]